MNELQPLIKFRPQCKCGCGKTTAGGNFKRGHDAKLLSSLITSVGGVLELKRLLDSLNIN